MTAFPCVFVMQTLAVGHCLSGSLSCSVVSLRVSSCWGFSPRVKTSLMRQLKGDRKAKTSTLIILVLMLEALWTLLWAGADIAGLQDCCFSFCTVAIQMTCQWRDACWEITSSEILYRFVLQKSGLSGEGGVCVCAWVGGGGHGRQCRADEPWKCFQWRGRQRGAQRRWPPLSSSPTWAVRLWVCRINMVKVLPQEACGAPSLHHWLTQRRQRWSLHSAFSVFRIYSSNGMRLLPPGCDSRWVSSCSVEARRWG